MNDSDLEYIIVYIVNFIIVFAKILIQKLQLNLGCNESLPTDIYIECIKYRSQTLLSVLHFLSFTQYECTRASIFISVILDNEFCYRFYYPSKSKCKKDLINDKLEVSQFLQDAYQFTKSTQNKHSFLQTE